MHSEALAQRRDVVEGLQIFARVSSRGNAQTYASSPGRSPVVLVHGLSMSSLYLAPTAVYLAEKYCTYAPDLPGYGRSEKPKKIFTIEEMAGFLGAWIDKMGLGEITLVGNSLGCQIIVEHALQHPGRASKIVLTGLTPDPGRRSFVQHLFRLFAAGMLEPPSFIPVMISDYLAAGLRRTLVTSRYILHDPIEQKLPLVNVPALVVRGSKDPIISQAWAEEAARLLPLGSLAVIPGAGHAVNWSYAEQLSRVVEEFIDQGRRERVS